MSQNASFKSKSQLKSYYWFLRISWRMKYVENGGKLGRIPKINKSKTDLILELLNQGKTKQEIADFLNVDRTTIYRILKRNGY